MRWMFYLILILASPVAQAAVDFSHVVGVELLLAEKSSRQFESRWGHAMIHLVDDDDDPFNDQVLSFAVDLGSSKLNYIKAARGRYPMIMRETDMGDMIREYMVTQNRGFQRIVLPMNVGQRDGFVKAVRYMESHPELLGSFDFINNSCTVGVVRLMMMAGFHVSVDDVNDSPDEIGAIPLPFLTPTDLVSYLTVRGQTNLPAIYEKPLSDDLPNFKVVPRQLYSTCAPGCQSLYDQFVKMNFSQTDFSRFAAHMNKAYLDQKHTYAMDTLINKRSQSPRPLVLDEPNYINNVRLVLSHR